MEDIDQIMYQNLNTDMSELDKLDTLWPSPIRPFAISLFHISVANGTNLTPSLEEPNFDNFYNTL